MKELDKTLIKFYLKNNTIIVGALKGLTFSGGEEQLRLVNKKIEDIFKIEILFHITHSKEVMQLVLLKDILDRTYVGVPIHLTLPYLPYGRQDRVCAEGEAYSLFAFGKILNLLKFTNITTWDVHSPKAFECIDNLINIPQHEIIYNSPLGNIIKEKELTIVTPDKGAKNKGIELVNTFFEKDQIKLAIYCAHKKRDPNTGHIIQTTVPELPKNEILIVDDICDGGRTFLELAKAIKKQGNNKIHLYVTHGIFSKGLEPFIGIIDHIYTPESTCFLSEQYIEHTAMKITLMKI